MPAADYTLGRGRVLFKRAGTNGFLDLGNSPDFQIALEAEKLPHFNSQSGLRVKDKEVTLEQILTVTFTLDEPVANNLSLFFSAEDATEATVASGSVADEALVARLDKWIQLANYNIDAGTFALTGVGGTPTYTLGTDYELLADQGWVRALSGGAITEALAIEADYDHNGVTTQSIDMATKSVIEGEVYFLGDPATGRIIDIHAKVSLSAEGEFPLISEDWLAFNFTAEALKDSAISTGLGKLIDRGVAAAA